MTDESLDPRLRGFSIAEGRAAPVDRLIDTHVHWTGRPEDIEPIAKAMQAARVETAFLISGSDSGAEWIDRADRVLGIGRGAVPYFMLDLQSNDPSQIDRAHDAGFWGLKWIGNSLPYDDRFFDPLLSRALERNMANLFHVGVLSGGKKSGAGMSVMRADMMDTVAKRYPELLIQGAHLGCPNIDEAFWGSEMNDNLYWDCSGGCRFHFDANPLVLHAAMHRRKRAWEAMMFGSDCASGPYPAEWKMGFVSKIDQRLAEWQDILSRLPVPPTSAQLDAFFYGNARRFMDIVRANRGMGS